MSPLVIVLLVNIATTFFKKYIFPKFGSTGVQMILLVCSIIASLVVYYNGVNADFSALMEKAMGIFMSAMVFYEILLKKFSVFYGKPTEEK